MPLFSGDLPRQPISRCGGTWMGNPAITDDPQDIPAAWACDGGLSGNWQDVFPAGNEPYPIFWQPCPLHFDQVAAGEYRLPFSIYPCGWH